MIQIVKKERNKMKKGFTIIETMLSMVFVGAMMLSIAVLVMNISETYNKGIAVKNVNAAGRGIIDDFKRSIAASPSFGSVDVACSAFNAAHVCIRNDGYEADGADGTGAFGVVNYDATIYYQGNDKPNGDAAYAGDGGRRFCTGLVSYVWNYRQNFNDNGTMKTGGDEHSVGDNIYASDNARPVKLVKVNDYGRDYCKYDTVNHRYFKQIEDIDKPEELLDQSDENDISYENLVLYDLVIFENERNRNIAQDSNQVFYSGSFVLGAWSGVDLDVPGATCIVPGEAVDSPEFYCAVNKFNFAQRAVGSSQ
ncbi:MAG: type II secretion system GspH family protein [Candidatus Nomurabacteria bacterium]|jgi:type II secretory pathway pseudopilin PulG|nr:type II secretion system GspH family protein [Candidatus Nomurabacteria bacterium]